MTEVAALRVFVGASRAEWLPVRVLEYSASQTTRKPVRFEALFDLQVPTPRHRRNQPGTNFSLYRFAVPKLCDYAGRALYLDSDTIVFRDIHELGTLPFEDASVLVTAIADADHQDKAGSVMLLDCGRLAWRVEEIVQRMDEGKFTYDALMLDPSVIDGARIRAAIPPHWNSLDRYEPNQTALLHYTNMHTQPWVTRQSPLGHLWLSVLQRACQDGFIALDEIAREVAAGNVRPSLLEQVREGIVESRELPERIKGLDAGFVAPYRRLQKNKGLDRAYRRARRELRKLKSALGVKD